MSGPDHVQCPVCAKTVTMNDINPHLDSHYSDSSGPSKPVSPFFKKERNKHHLETNVSSHQSATKFIEPEPNPTKKTKLTRRDTRPLAERARPKSLDEYVGQEELVGERGIIRNLIEQDRCNSMILWGSAGTGKTTLARLIAVTTKSRFIEISATSTTVADCRKIFEDSQNYLTLTGRKTIIFLDEVHRFNRAQQDIFCKFDIFLSLQLTMTSANG